MNRITVDIPDLKRNLQRLVRAAVGEGMKSWFKDVEKRLFQLTEQAKDDESREAYFDAVASIKRDRQLFEEQLIDTLERGDLAKKVPHAWSDLVKDRTLALEIEDAEARARARFGIEHAQYEARIAWLNEQDSAQIPEGLYTLPCLTTAIAVNLSPFPPAAQNELIRALGSQLLNRLEPLYVLLNDYLIQAGVLARIRSIRNGKDNAASTEDRSIHDILTAMDVIEPKVLSGTELHAAIFRLSDKGKQPAIVDRIDGWHPELLQEVIQAHLRRQGENARINPEELQSIKLVGLLFSGIMNDPKVRLSVRQKILSLQWPVLSVALRERGFFRHASHPARDVPNLCALIGSDPNAAQATLIELGSIIDRVVLNHENNVKAFSQARDDLKALEQHGAGKGVSVETDEKTAEQERAAHYDMLQRCQQRVRETIHKRIAEHALSGTQIQPETSKFINRIIDPAMVTAMINYGRNSLPWLEAEASLDAALDLQSAHDIEPTREMAFRELVWEMLELVDQGTPQMKQHLNTFINSLDWTSRRSAPVASTSKPVADDDHWAEELVSTESSSEQAGKGAPVETGVEPSSVRNGSSAGQETEALRAVEADSTEDELPPTLADADNTPETDDMAVADADATRITAPTSDAPIPDAEEVIPTEDSVATANTIDDGAVSEISELSTNDNSEHAYETVDADENMSSETAIDETVAEVEEATLESESTDVDSAPAAPSADELAQAEKDREDARIAQSPAVLHFVQTHLMNNEWFQVYTGTGNALRRLKGKDINQTLGVVNFANRTGELELFLPLSQLVHDLLEERTRPVFENPTYNRALAELKGLLDSETTHDD